MAATYLDTDAIHTGAAVWSANMAKIGELMRERDLLRIRAEAAEAELRLYRIELRNANAIRCGLMNELAELRFGPRPAAVVIPIREVGA